VSADTPPPATVPFGAALRFWLKLGFISFGGPAGQIALLHAELVERRRWISEGRFLHALNYCMLLPGPEAQQLATYLGWLMHRSWGGIVAGTLFVLPSLAILALLSWAYLVHGQQPLVAGFFQGLKPAVVALVLHAGWRIGSRTLRHPLLWALALVALVAHAWAGVPFPDIVVAAAGVGWLGARRWPQAFEPAGAGHAARAAGGRAAAPAVIDDDTPTPLHARRSRAGLVRVLVIGLALWALALAALVATFGWQGLLVQMGLFFTQAALVTFGGAYAVLPHVVQGAVEQHQWLSSAQMMDGLALGETTPGPLIMVVAFVGFVGGWQAPVFGADSALASGVAAALVVTFFTFLPSFVFVLAGGPLVEATRGRLGFTAPLAAISAAVVGVIVDLALFFAGHVFWPRGPGGALDVAAVVLAAAAFFALWRLRWGVVPVLLACGTAGVALQLAATMA
jgi:chromate transporter